MQWEGKERLVTIYVYRFPWLRGMKKRDVNGHINGHEPEVGSVCSQICSCSRLNHVTNTEGKCNTLQSEVDVVSIMISKEVGSKVSANSIISSSVSNEKVVEGSNEKVVEGSNEKVVEGSNEKVVEGSNEKVQMRKWWRPGLQFKLQPHQQQHWTDGRAANGNGVSLQHVQQP